MHRESKTRWTQSYLYQDTLQLKWKRIKIKKETYKQQEEINYLWRGDPHKSHLLTFQQKLWRPEGAILYIESEEKKNSATKNNLPIQI